jgi:hypothetical protein
MSNRIPPRITHFWLPIISILVILSTNVGCDGSKAVAGETWTIVKILTVGESISSTTNVVTVRNCCDIPESKTFSCNAGTVNELSIILGGSVGISAIGEVTINPAASASLGIARGAGETLELGSPPGETIYHYNITTVHTVKAGEAEIVSSTGETLTTSYTFQASCSLRIEPIREHLACTEICPTPLPPAEVSPDDTSPPVVESPRTPTPRQATQPSLQSPPSISSPKPELILPLYGEYNNPFTFRWSGSQSTEYRVVLTHQDKADKRYMSDWLNQHTWTTNIPAEDFGNWRWFVTTRDGVRSDESSFVYQPFPGSRPSSLPPVEGGHSTPQPPAPVESTVTPPYPPPYNPYP